MPKSLFIYSIFYGGMVCIAGVLGNKQVALGPLTIDPGFFPFLMLGDKQLVLGPLAIEAGIFPFLMLVITSSAVAELHGKKIADQLVRFGFIPLVASILLTLFVLWLPPAKEMDPARLSAFDTVLGQSPRLMIAGIISYGTSQTLNIYVFERLRSGMGKLVWLRGALAAVLSQVIDTLLFVTISFYGIFPIAELLAGQMIAKITLSLLLVPFVIQFMIWLARKLDQSAPTA